MSKAWMWQSGPVASRGIFLGGNWAALVFGAAAWPCLASQEPKAVRDSVLSALPGDSRLYGVLERSKPADEAFNSETPTSIADRLAGALDRTVWRLDQVVDYRDGIALVKLLDAASRPDGVLYVFDFTKHTIRRLSESYRVYSARLSPDGTRIAAVTWSPDFRAVLMLGIENGSHQFLVAGGVEPDSLCWVDHETLMYGESGEIGTAEDLAPLLRVVELDSSETHSIETVQALQEMIGARPAGKAATDEADLIWNAYVDWIAAGEGGPAVGGGPRDGEARGMPGLKLPYRCNETWVVTRAYNTVSHTGRDYYALDFALSGCDAWQRPMLAAAGGTVTYAAGSAANTCGTVNTYGQWVEIDHGGGYRSLYGHLEGTTVSQNQGVSQGTQIGRCGNAGNACGSACPTHPGTHLHFRMNLNGNAHRPEPMSGYSGFSAGGWYTSDNGCGGSSTEDNAQFVRGTIPDSMQAGTSTSVSVTFRNNGTSTWTRDTFKLAAVDDNDPFAQTRHLLNDGESIGPGQEKSFTFNFSAPGSTGSYATDWRMVHEGVRWFGDTHAKTVNVTGSGGGGGNGRKNIISRNPSFESFPGGDWKEPIDWRLIWGDYDNDWFWRPGNGYCSENGTCGWCVDSNQGRLAVRPAANRNVLIGQQGWNRDDQYPWANPLSDMGFSGRTRLVAKVWRKTCRSNLFLGWCERERQWSNDGGNAEFRLGQDGNYNDNSAEGDIEYKNWSADWARWVGGLVGVHEGDYDSNGRLTLFDDYWLAFEIAAKYNSHNTPSELWAGETNNDAWVKLTSYGWDNFGHRTGDWRLKTNNDDGSRIALNQQGGAGQNAHTGLQPDGNDGTFRFRCYGYMGAGHNPDGDNNYNPSFYFRREGGDDVDCVAWDDNPSYRNIKLRWGFSLVVKGHRPALRNLSAEQLVDNPGTVRFSFGGFDRRNDPVTFTAFEYRVGAGGAWTAANHGNPSSTQFGSDGPSITVDWNAGADLGLQTANDVYFRMRVNDGVYDSEDTQIGPFSVLFETDVPGDIDDDGDLDETDVGLFVGVVLGFMQQPEFLVRADMNGDGAVNGGDIAGFVQAATVP